LRSKLTEESASWRKEIGSAHTGILKSQKEIESYALSIKQSAGAFQPSGGFLSEEIASILENCELEECECAKTIETLVKKLSTIFLANAEFGIQIQKLYVGKKDEVFASTMYLSQKSSPYALALLREKLNFEKKLPKPDPELIEALVKTISEMERRLELSSTGIEDQGKQKQ